MLISQYLVLLQKLSPIYTASLNTVFSIPQNQCYPGATCTRKYWRLKTKIADFFSISLNGCNQITIKKVKVTILFQVIGKIQNNSGKKGFRYLCTQFFFEILLD